MVCREHKFFIKPTKIARQGIPNQAVVNHIPNKFASAYPSLPNSKTSKDMLLRFTIDLFIIVLSLIQQLLGIQENVWAKIKAGLINHNGLELDCHGPHASNAWALTKRSWWCYSCIVMHHAEDAQRQATAGRGCLHRRAGLAGLSRPWLPKTAQGEYRGSLETMMIWSSVFRLRRWIWPQNLALIWLSTKVVHSLYR